MKTVEDFEPFVLAYAPFVPQELIQHAIREAIVEFMRETKIATDTIEFETQEKVPDYMLEVPDCRRIIKVNHVQWTPAKCSGRENWESLRNGDDGDYIIELRRGSHPIVVFDTPPRKVHRVRVDYSWSIGRDDCDIPAYIYDDFMNTIVAGALLRIGMLPDQAEILRQAQLHQATWFNGIQSAKIEKSGGRAKRMIGSPFLARRGRGSLWR